MGRSRQSELPGGCLIDGWEVISSRSVTAAALCLRRELPQPGARNFACGANYPVPGARVLQFCLRRELPCTRSKGASISPAARTTLYQEQGRFNFACGANYPVPGARALQFRLRRELPCTRSKGASISPAARTTLYQEQGRFNFACGAN